MNPCIVVAGSVNQDLIITTPRMPRLGETITGSGFATARGGKGANQAVAAARLGGKVSFIAAVGDDEAGRGMLTAFAQDGIDTAQIQVVPDTPTGTAVIMLCGGDNCIVLDSGANNAVTPAMMDAAEGLITEAGLLLLQLEIPLPSVIRGVELAQQHGVPVLLNPAPALALTDGLLSQIDLLTPNESECALLTGIPIETTDDAKRAAAALNRRGVKQVIITLGGLGAVYNDGERLCHRPAYGVDAVVDTTAAGDCFTAALAVALTEGADIHEAVGFASAASALAVTQKGAQPSLPYREAVSAFAARKA